MRVVVGMTNGHDPEPLRRVLLGAGLHCSSEDCVALEEIGVALAQQDAGLVVVQLEDNSAPDWTYVREAASLTQAPILVIGPDRTEYVTDSRRAGASEYLENRELRTKLDSTLDQLQSQGAIQRRRGQVVVVAAANAGAGGSTVAINLAGAWAKIEPGETALIELASVPSDLAILVDLQPERTVRDVCQRWQSLDATSLSNCFAEHSSGLRLLVNGEAAEGNPELTVESVRRLAILSRALFSHTVLAVEGTVDEAALEAMKLSDTLVVVARPDVPSVRRARTLIGKAEEAGLSRERIRLVINRWGQSGQLTMAQIEKAIGMSPSALIVDDPKHVNKAINKGVLLRELSPRSTICRRFTELAMSINGAKTSK